MKCPKCQSENIHLNEKGVSVGKAALGAAICGPIGLLAGGIGKNKLMCKCLDCGNSFSADYAISMENKRKKIEELKQQIEDVKKNKPLKKRSSLSFYVIVLISIAVTVTYVICSL